MKKDRNIFLSRHAALMALMLSISIISLQARSTEIQQIEALGVVNGNIIARHNQVDVSVFLSGKSLFHYTDNTNNTPLTTLQIEGATLVTAAPSQDAGVIWIQQPVTLKAVTGQVQVPLQVRVNDKPVTVSAIEDSSGITILLPENAYLVDVIPAGAVHFWLPSDYRGDLHVDLRITGHDDVLNTKI